MNYRLMSLPMLHLLRLMGLTHAVEPIEVAGDSRRRWAVLVRGRGFNRLIEDELLEAPALHRPRSALEPRAKRFPSRAAAMRYIRSVSLGNGCDV
jgi:hypothetical protein